MIGHRSMWQNSLESSRQHNSKYELGKINVPAEMFMKLADLYGVSVDYLMGRTDRP